MSQPNPHRGVCCVCTRVYREGIEPVSHGYCSRACVDQLEAAETDDALWAELQRRARQGARVQLAGCLR